MTYKNYYLQASEISDKIGQGEVTSVAREQNPNSGLLSRRPQEEPEQEGIDPNSAMILDYFRAIDELPSPKIESNEQAPEESRRPPSKGFIPKDTKTLLAKTLQAEAGNQGYDGMVAVGAVISNRAKSGKYGEDIKGVIMKPGQFSAWNSVTGYAGGEQGQDMANVRPSKEALAAADAILQGNFEDKTGGATHYFAEIPGVSPRPKWANDSFKPIGDHYFGKAN